MYSDIPTCILELLYCENETVLCKQFFIDLAFTGKYDDVMQDEDFKWFFNRGIFTTNGSLSA